MRERRDAPYLRGQAAACIALEPSDNPFPPNSADFVEWLRGYREWQRDHVQSEQGDPQRRAGARRGAMRFAKLTDGA